MSDSDACEVPFCEQLRSVPTGFRASREIQWADDGTPTGHQLIPVGFMFHRAADALDAKDARIKELEGALLRTGAWEIAPCCICGYNGPGYYQPDTHACANRAREALK